MMGQSRISVTAHDTISKPLYSSIIEFHQRILALELENLTLKFKIESLGKMLELTREIRK